MVNIARSKLLEWFRYEPETGLVYWQKRPARGGYNTKVGDVAGTINDRAGRRAPRRVLWLGKQRIVAARAIYTMVHGDIPNSAMIDHADGNTLNDRIDNLRLASAVQNTWNRIGLDAIRKGVAKDIRGRFKARIATPDGKINLGTWDTEAEAHAAYMGAAAILHGEYWLGNRKHAATAIGNRRA